VLDVWQSGGVERQQHEKVEDWSEIRAFKSRGLDRSGCEQVEALSESILKK